MTRILMIEDEEPAARRLWKMISEISQDFTLLHVADSVTGSEK